MSDNKKDWGKIRKEMELEEEKMQEIDDWDEDEESGGEGSPEKKALDSPDVADLEQKLFAAEQQAHENWEKAVRATAELENVRRRATEDVRNAHKFGIEKFVNALLPIADSLEQALQGAEQDAKQREGIELTMKLFLDALEKFDVRQINPEGEVFDPQLHEAISMQDAPGVAPNTVLVVFQKGYTLHNRVIRPARVIVSRK